MKKSLSLLVAVFMVITMFANVAFADTTPAAPTTQQKYDALVAAGVFDGFPDGKAHLDENMTRAQLAKVLAKLYKLPELTTKSFTDTTGHWAAGYIEAVSKSDPVLMEGTWTGIFSPDANVKLEEIAKILVVALKLPLSTNTVTGADDWAKAYVATAVAANLIPASSDYTQPAPRGVLVDASAVAAAKIAKPNVVSAVATVNTDGTATVSGKVENADSVKVAVGTDAAVAATLNADGTFTYKTKVLAVGDTNIVVTAYKGTDASAATTVKATIDALAVSAVNVLNAKQVQVKFNKEVQAGVAANGAELNTNYSVTIGAAGTIPTNPTRAALDSTDKTSVILTWANGIEGQASQSPALYGLSDTYRQFQVKNVKSTGGLQVPDYKAALMVADSTGPTATVSYSAPNTSVTFSEPMRGNSMVNPSKLDASYTGATYTGATVSVDGVARTDYTATPDNTSDALAGVTKITFAGLAAGTHRIDIVGARDLDGNFLPDWTGSITVAADSTAPTVTSVTSTGNKIKVKFSEPIVDATINGQAATRVWVTVNGDPTYYAIAANATDSNVNDEYTIDATRAIPTGSNFVNATVVVNAGSKDASGNTSSASGSYTLTISKDTTAPTVVSTTSNNNQIIVKLSEGITVGTNPIGSTVTTKFVNTDGVVNDTTTATLSSVAYKYDANNDGDPDDSGENAYLVLTVDPTIDTTHATPASGSVPAKLKAGTYTVTIPANAVKDSANNGLAADTKVSFTVTAGSSANKTLVATVSQPSPGVLEFDYNAIVTTSALSASNYFINGSALPAGTNLYYYNNKTSVKAELPAGTIGVSGTRTITAKNVVDENGNTLNDASGLVGGSGVLVYLTETVKPTAVSASVLSGQSLNVVMSEAIKDPTGATGIEVWVNGSKIDTSSNGLTFGFAADSNGVTKNLTIGAAIANTFAIGQSIVVKFVDGSNVQDLAGNTVVAGQVTAQ